MKTIVLSNPAAKDFDALPETVGEIIVTGSIRCVAFGDGDVKRLSDRVGLRLRPGRYKVIFAKVRRQHWRSM